MADQPSQLPGQTIPPQLPPTAFAPVGGGRLFQQSIEEELSSVAAPKPIVTGKPTGKLGQYEVEEEKKN